MNKQNKEETTKEINPGRVTMMKIMMMMMMMMNRMGKRKNKPYSVKPHSI
jgi:hypothetical protein